MKLFSYFVVTVETVLMDSCGSSPDKSGWILAFAGMTDFIIINIFIFGGVPMQVRHY